MKSHKTIAQDILDAFARRIDQGKAGTCPVCGRVFAVYVPRGGNGSARRMRHHSQELFSGTFVSTRRCPGSGKFAKEWC